MRTLPNDVARCESKLDVFDFVEQCRHCLRYTQRETDSPRQSWMVWPPEFVDGKCPRFEGDV